MLSGGQGFVAAVVAPASLANKKAKSVLVWN